MEVLVKARIGITIIIISHEFSST